MAAKNESMTGRGPDQAATAEEVLQIIEGTERPVWSASTLAEYIDVSRPTATSRLKELKEEHEAVQTVKVGNTTVYFTSDSDNLTIAEEHERSLLKWLEDRFVGLETAPWTAINPADGPAEAGDKIQLQVHGSPGNWGVFWKRHWENKREQLDHEETSDDETQALVSGELYAKPTTPIEHIEYPADYDLELNIGARTKETENGTITIATGVKNHLIRPCNDAVFLTDVSVDWLSPKGEGQELEVYGFDTVEESAGDGE